MWSVWSVQHSSCWTELLPFLQGVRFPMKANSPPPPCIEKSSVSRHRELRSRHIYSRSRCKPPRRNRATTAALLSHRFAASERVDTYLGTIEGGQDILRMQCFGWLILQHEAKSRQPLHHVNLPQLLGSKCGLVAKDAGACKQTRENRACSLVAADCMSDLSLRTP